MTLPFAADAQTGAETAVLLNAAPRPTAAMPPPMPPPAPAGKTAAQAKIPTASRVSTPVCSGEFSPTAKVNLPEGKSGLLDLQQLQLPSPAWLRIIGDPEVIQIEPTTSPTPRTMFFLFGKNIGTTNLMFQNKEGRCAMVEVSVGVDTAAVQTKLSQLMPEEKNIRISAAADSLVLTGTVADAMAADQVIAISRAYLRKDWRKTGGSAGGAGGGAGGGGGGGASSEDRIVNMLAIAAPQQVMLEVKVAEVSKSLLDKLGIGITARASGGSWAYTLLSSFLTGSSGLLDAKKSNGSQITLDAEKDNGLVRLLSEPNVMAISGQEGSFLAGGKIFIPVPQGNGGGITLEEREFGIGLKFTPTVLAGGRINIKVSPEVSELSPTGASFTSPTGNSTSILPLITTRRAATTVQLNDGQSFAIGGLIKNNTTTNVAALPILGEIPVLGALFRSTAFQQDKTELLFVITPHLVQPLPPNYSLPTDGVTNPSRGELFLMGRMEGKPASPPAQAANQPVTPKMDEDKSQPKSPSGFELK
ncbi:type II and III secretion system protein family protein [Undibacterium sp.]|uniref:type II and III secretion system protein family protein n=1 Tax=Undibacterium sp. TaxID=1914977 RepID=UPI002CC3CCED|nr:type II and III secretion system protein family protein [Undibacterium sp.]HTD04523.1 type II and III secretion system protein family protein [Undibacterium sp.]